MQDLTASMTRWWIFTYSAGFDSTIRIPGQRLRALRTEVSVLIPNFFASQEAAMQQLVSAITGATPTGFPRGVEVLLNRSEETVAVDKQGGKGRIHSHRWKHREGA